MGLCPASVPHTTFSDRPPSVLRATGSTGSVFYFRLLSRVVPLFRPVTRRGAACAARCGKSGAAREPRAVRQLAGVHISCEWRGLPLYGVVGYRGVLGGSANSCRLTRVLAVAARGVSWILPLSKASFARRC